MRRFYAGLHIGILAAPHFALRQHNRLMVFHRNDSGSVPEPHRTIRFQYSPARDAIVGQQILLQAKNRGEDIV